MTTAQVIETSVTNNSLSKDYPYLEDHAKQITDTPGFKPFTIFLSLPHKVHSVPSSSNPGQWIISDRRQGNQQTDRQTDRQTNEKETGMQTDRQTTKEMKKRSRLTD